MKPRFAMFYSDQTLLDDGEDVEVAFKVPRVWLDAPKDGLQAVVVHRDDGKLTVHIGRDIHAVMPSGDLMNTNDLGPLMRSIGLAKYGLWIPDDDFDQIHSRLKQHRREYEV